MMITVRVFSDWKVNLSVPNQLLNEMLAVKAMPYQNHSYLPTSEWDTTTSVPPKYACSMAWPVLVTPDWMIADLQPTPYNDS